jgi:hypothetical protein
MGFSLHIFPFHNGEQREFERSLLLDIFGPDSDLERSNFAQIEFPDGSGAGEIYGVDEETVTSIMFTHFGGFRFYEAVWRLADRTSALIVWPGSKGNFAVTKAETLEHTPPELHALQKPIKVATSVQELIDYMNEQLS